MFRPAPLLLVLFSCMSASGQENDAIDGTSLSTEIAQHIVEAWRRDIERVTNRNRSPELPNTVWEKLEGTDIAFLREFDWARAKQLVASQYAEGYSETELKEISGFLATAAGKKFIANHIAIRSEVMKQMAIEKDMEHLRKRTEKNIQQVMEALAEPERKLVMDAINTPSDSEKLIAGKWYADDFDEEGNGYRGSHELKLSGVCKYRAIEVDHRDKTFLAYDSDGIWVIKGSLLAETFLMHQMKHRCISSNPSIRTS